MGSTLRPLPSWKVSHSWRLVVPLPNYLEQRGLIGAVVRSDDRRIYSERQVVMLELIARLRELEVRLDEAAALAQEWTEGGAGVVPNERLDALVTQAIGENVRRARLVADLTVIRRRRDGAA